MVRFRLGGSAVVCSMTGFGHASAEVAEGRSVRAEVRLTNHRYLDIVLRLPVGWGAVEESLRAICRRQVSRGRCEVTLALESGMPPSLNVDLDLVDQYYKALKMIADRFGVPSGLDARTLIELSAAARPQQPNTDTQDAWPAAEAVLQQALQVACANRAAEGAVLRADLLVRVDQLEAMIADLVDRQPAISRAAMEQWRQRLQWLLGAPEGGPVLDEPRLLMEAGIWAERADISEELVRLGSHLQQLRAALDATGSVGRRCDFLAQELSREWNTIGSKALQASVTQVAVEGKTIVEQIREQLQNLE